MPGKPTNSESGASFACDFDASEFGLVLAWVYSLSTTTRKPGSVETGNAASYVAATLMLILSFISLEEGKKLRIDRKLSNKGTMDGRTMGKRFVF